MPATKPVTFESKYRALKLIRKPQVEEIIAGVGKRIIQRPLRYQFTDGRLMVTPGADRLQDSTDWLAAGEDQEATRDAVEALKAHRTFGRDFWEVGHGPGTLYPRPEEIREELDAAIATLNAPVVEARLTEERDTHDRSQVVDWCEGALRVIAKMEQALEERATQEPASKPPAAKK